jgi:hypothetical protein
MRRQVEPTELDTGTWLRLECGHPAPVELRNDGTAECALCDRYRRTADRSTLAARSHA